MVRKILKQVLSLFIDCGVVALKCAKEIFKLKGQASSLFSVFILEKDLEDYQNLFINKVT
jgi:hypothetical protein